MLKSERDQMHMIADKSRHLIFPIVFLLILFVFPILCYPGTNPDLLQQRAIKRIDNFIDCFRKTGEHIMDGLFQTSS